MEENLIYQQSHRQNQSVVADRSNAGWKFKRCETRRLSAPPMYLSDDAVYVLTQQHQLWRPMKAVQSRTIL